MRPSRRPSGGPGPPPAGGQHPHPGRRPAPGRPCARRPRWLCALAWQVDLLLLAVLAVGLLAVGLNGRSLPLPDPLTRRAETALAGMLAPHEVRLGGLALGIGGAEAGGLTLRLRDLRIATADGQAALHLPELLLASDARRLLAGQILPRRIETTGGTLRLPAETDPPGRAPAPNLPPPERLLADLDRLRDQPALTGLGRITLRDLTVTRGTSGPGAQATLGITQDRGGLDAALTLDPAAGGRAALRLRLPARIAEGRAEPATLSVLLDAIPAAALAPETPMLAWLAPVQAPVTGTLVARLGAGGQPDALDGTLSLGAGRLDLPGGARDLEQGRSDFAWRAGGPIVFRRLSLVAPPLRLAGRAEMTLSPGTGLWPEAAALRLDLDRLELPVGVPAGASADLAGPVRFDSGQIRARARFTPALRIDLDEARLGADRPPRRAITATGHLHQTPAGMQALIALEAGAQPVDALLALWPAQAAPGARGWLAGHLLGGQVTGGRFRLALIPGQPPDLRFDAGFRAAGLRPMTGLAEITAAAGQVGMRDQRLSLTLSAGQMAAAGAGPVDLAGSTLELRLHPGDAPDALRIAIAARGRVEDATRLLETPALGLMGRAGLPPAPATGDFAGTGWLRLWLHRDGPPTGLEQGFGADLHDLSAPDLVPGHTLRATHLVMQGDAGGLVLSGAVRLDDRPIEARLDRPAGPGPTRVRGRTPLDPGLGARLGLPPAQVALSGAAALDLTLDLPRDGPPVLDLRSDLVGLGLGLPDLGWSKPAATPAELALTARLGPRPEIAALSLRAPGITAEGRMDLAPARLDLAQLSVGAWLSGTALRLDPTSGAVRLEGGTLDLRGMPAGGPGTGPGAPLRLDLDAVRLTDRLTLRGVTADLRGSAAGLEGRFSGQLGPGAPLSGQIDAGGLHLHSDAAGPVLMAAGVLDRARGGQLDLTLAPGSPLREGQLRISDLRVEADEGLVALLNAASIVGLIEQLGGPGLLFNTIEARFRLGAAQIDLLEASGTGPSLGISAEGVYDIAEDRLDLGGVVSPVYVLNGLGGVFSRRGEGLFGATWRMRGPARAPQTEVNPLALIAPGPFRDLFRPRRPENVTQ